MIDLDRVRSELANHRIEWHSTIGSTMTEASRLAAAGCDSGTVVGAEEQTAGQGRHGGIGAGYNRDIKPGLAAIPDQPVAGVGNQRHAGITDQRHRPAGVDFLDDFGAGLARIMVMIGKQWLFDAIG